MPETEPPTANQYLGWPIAVKWVPHLWDAAVKEPLALILCVVIGIQLMKVYRGDTAEMDQQRALLEMNTRMFTTSLDSLVKVFAASIDNLANEVKRNTAATEANTRQRSDGKL